MDSLLEEMQSRGMAVERRFEIRYQKREEKLKYDLKGLFSGSAFGIGKNIFITDPCIGGPRRSASL